MTLEEANLNTMHTKSQRNKKIMKIGSAVGVIFLFMMFIVPSLIDWDQYRDSISKELSKFLNAEVSIYGNVKGSIFPTKIIVPHIKIKYEDPNGYDSSFASIGELDIDLSIFSILTMSPIINKVVIHEPDFSIDHIRKFNRSGNGNFNVVIKKGKVNLFSEVSTFSKYIEEIDGKLDINGSKISLDSSFYIDTHKYNIDITTSSDEIEFKVKSSSFELSFDGEEDKEYIKGKLKGEGDQFHILIGDLLGFKTAHIRSKDEFTFKSELSISKNAFYIKNVELKSDYIFGRGYVVGDWNKNADYDISLNIQEFDLDNLFSRYSSLGGRSLHNMMDLLYVNIDKSTISKFNINIDNLTYDGNLIKKSWIKGGVKDGSFMIDDMAAELDDGSKLGITGNTTSNEVRTEFNGKMSMYGKSSMPILNLLLPKYMKITSEEKRSPIDMTSDLIIQPALVTLNNIDMKIGDGRVDGILSLRKYNDLPRLIGSVNIEDVDFNNYDVKVEDAYSEQAIWLRNIRREVDIAIDMNNVTIGDSNVGNMSFIMETSPSSLMLNRIEYFSDKSKFTGNIALMANDIVPELNIFMKAEYLDLGFFNNVGLFSIDYNEDNVPIKFSWSDKDINWRGADKFKGKLRFIADKVKNDYVDAGNMDLDANINNGSIAINNLEGNMYNGTVKANGSVSMYGGFRLAFALNNINVRELSRSLDSDIAGYMAVNGSISAKGKSLQKMSKTLQGSTKFDIRNLDYSGISVDKLISTIDTISRKSELISLSNNVFNKNGRTLFSRVAGESKIQNGIGVTTFKYNAGNATGSSVTYFYFNSFLIDSLMRWSFRLPSSPSRTIFADMKVKSLIFKPEKYFDTSILEKQINFSPR